MTRIKVAVDANISPRVVRMLEGLYGTDQCEFIQVAELMPGAAPDEVWADRFGQFDGRGVLSADPRIAYRPHQVRAFMANGFISVFLDGA